VQSPLFRYLLGLTGDRQVAEDVLQEAFLGVYRKLEWLRDAALFRPWCYRICTREVFRRLRRERFWRDLVRDEEALKQVASPEPSPGPDPDLVARLPELIGQASPAARAVLALHYLDQRTLDEIASELRLPVGTVKSRLSHGLTQIRRSLEGPTHGPQTPP
jgi:RNA polymerase sigma-70 factor (ECF subfamily)